MTRCPNDDQWVRFVDGTLSIEETARLGEHVAACSLCRTQDQALRTLIADVRADDAADFDVESHARAVMDRLETGRPYAARRPFAWAAPPRVRWLVGGAAACGLLLAARHAPHSPKTPKTTDAWQARGGLAPSTLGRDVGVQPYAARGGLDPLSSGAIVDGTTPFTAGFRNVGHAPAFLLLFAVDAAGTVHWISPPYVSAQGDPASTTLAETADERVLGTTAVFDDLADGPLRIVAVITPTPAHVSDVEDLGADVTAGRLARRLPGAEVRETLVEVRDAGGAQR